MKAQFELHRTDNHPFTHGEGDRIFSDAIRRTRYPMTLHGIAQENGSVTGTIHFTGTQQYYKLQLLLRELQKIPDVQLQYRGLDI